MARKDKLPRFANVRDGGNLTQPDDLQPYIDALRWTRTACAIAFFALMALLAAQTIATCWNKAINSSLTFEVFRG